MFQKQRFDDTGLRGATTDLPIEKLLFRDPVLTASMPRWFTWCPMWLKKCIFNAYPPPILRELGRQDPGALEDARALGRLAHLSDRQVQLALAGELQLCGGGPAGCSVLAVDASRSPTHGPMLIRACDLPGSLARYNVVRWIQRKGELPSLQYSLVPLPGCFSGMNEYLAVAMNVGLSCRRGKSLVPTSIRLRQILATCRSTDEAIDLLCRVDHAGGAIVTLVDVRSCIAAVEIAGDVVRIRRPANGLLVVGNHYAHRGCIPLDRARMQARARVGGLPPILPSSQRRVDRLLTMADGRGELDLEDALSMLRDHDGRHTCHDQSICRANGFYETIAAMVMLPRRGLSHAAGGRPCRSDFVEHHVLDDDNHGSMVGTPRRSVLC